MDPLEWLNLDGAAPTYQGQSFFAPQPSQQYSGRATRARALENELLKQQQLRLQVQQEMQRQQQEALAASAAPLLMALDPAAEDYSTRRAQTLSQIPPGAIMDRGVQNWLQSNDYANRMASRPDPRIESILMDNPELQDDYEVEIATVGPGEATKNLRYRARNRELEKQLVDYGFDINNTKELKGLQLPGKPYLDPVRVASWVKTKGTKALEALTPEKEVEYRASLIKALEKANDPLIQDPETKRLLREQAAWFQSKLPGGGGSALPMMGNEPLAPQPTAAPRPLVNPETGKPSPNIKSLRKIE